MDVSSIFYSSPQTSIRLCNDLMKQRSQKLQSLVQKRMPWNQLSHKWINQELTFCQNLEKEIAIYATCILKKANENSDHYSKLAKWSKTTRLSDMPLPILSAIMTFCPESDNALKGVIRSQNFPLAMKRVSTVNNSHLRWNYFKEALSDLYLFPKIEKEVIDTLIDIARSFQDGSPEGDQAANQVVTVGLKLLIERSSHRNLQQNEIHQLLRLILEMSEDRIVNLDTFFRILPCDYQIDVSLMDVILQIMQSLYEEERAEKIIGIYCSLVNAKKSDFLTSQNRVKEIEDIVEENPQREREWLLCFKEGAVIAISEDESIQLTRLFTLIPDPDLRFQAFSKIKHSNVNSKEKLRVLIIPFSFEDQCKIGCVIPCEHLPSLIKKILSIDDPFARWEEFQKKIFLIYPYRKVEKEVVDALLDIARSFRDGSPEREGAANEVLTTGLENLYESGYFHDLEQQEIHQLLRVIYEMSAFRTVALNQFLAELPEYYQIDTPLMDIILQIVQSLSEEEKNKEIILIHNALVRGKEERKGVTVIISENERTELVRLFTLIPDPDLRAHAFEKIERIVSV